MTWCTTPHRRPPLRARLFASCWRRMNGSAPTSPPRRSTLCWTQHAIRGSVRSLPSAVRCALARSLQPSSEEDIMIVEEKLKALGLTLPNLDEQYRKNTSGARFISHYAVQNVLYLSGTTPLKDGEPFNQGVVGKDLTLEQGYEAARYAALTSLAAVQYALGDLDRVQQIVQIIGFVNSAPGFSDQP